MKKQREFVEIIVLATRKSTPAITGFSTTSSGLRQSVHESPQKTAKTNNS